MGIEVEFAWTWTHSLKGICITECDFYVYAEVIDGEAIVTDVFADQNVYGNIAEGVRGVIRTDSVSLKSADDAFGQALYRGISSAIESDEDFQGKAVELAQELSDDYDREQRRPARSISFSQRSVAA